ncbi:hypothetical protein Nepgr_002456 [Nepenthes gracilis]|uniref:C2H2-type domain-containing protein n=1 Tax=Nepenthes gracilis TaxID=150966 RepID=A0AAD3RWX1_NEPGR|nr:hypothetical protein Nepgr_002456 [Nepenthes gracilis]
MASIVDQKSNFKHVCKICKKGFVCGSALGGHMRAHGTGDERRRTCDVNHGSDWDGKLEGGGSDTPPSNKRKYALRTNPNRMRNCRACENCGQMFLSWKSFLEHSKCGSEDAGSPASSPKSAVDDDLERRTHGGGSIVGGWFKRKRSVRVEVDNIIDSINCPSSEEEYLAVCLMMLSRGTVDPSDVLADQQPKESPPPSADKNDERRNGITFIGPRPLAGGLLDKAEGVAKGALFECKACSKVFHSHQALGGHRASHNKIKGCFAARGIIMVGCKRKSKVHECSICHQIFSSGQALGGHKRCHWIAANPPGTSSSLPTFQHPRDHVEEARQRPIVFIQPEQPFDLNVAEARYKLSTQICLQLGDGVETETEEKRHHCNNHQDEDDNEREQEDKKTKKMKTSHESMKNEVRDEVDNSKQTKLGELKDLDVSRSSSLWLRVGLGSSDGVGADHP